MNEEAGLLDAIFSNPDDDTPRLVYADWLDDRGGERDAARAAFIRLQCDIARLPLLVAGYDPANPDVLVEVENPEVRSLREREVALWRENNNDWIAGLPGGEFGQSVRVSDDSCEATVLFNTDYDTYYTFRRGFAEVSPGLPVAMLRAGIPVWVLIEDDNETAFDLTPQPGFSPYAVLRSGLESDGMVRIMTQRMGGFMTQAAAHQFRRSPHGVPTDAT